VGNGSRIGRLKECAAVRVNLGVTSLSRVLEKGFVKKDKAGVKKKVKACRH